MEKSTDELVKALRWIAENDEIVFDADIAREAADALERQSLLINNPLWKVREAKKLGSCENCKFFATEKTTGLHWCRTTGGLCGNLKKDDFCSRGKPKEDVENETEAKASMGRNL